MSEVDHRKIAVETYNHCWDLLERDQRSQDEDIELLTSAFTSRYHWSFAGGPEQWTVSDWMVSRAAASIGEGSLSLAFALRANSAVQEFDAPDWLVASTAEGLARAYGALGDEKVRDEWIATASNLVEAIADEDDRDLIASQLSSVPR
ncbi:MAG: hypothetical protein WA359_01280 [Acidimicrobiales bacterium]